MSKPNNQSTSLSSDGSNILYFVLGAISIVGIVFGINIFSDHFVGFLQAILILLLFALGLSLLIIAFRKRLLVYVLGHANTHLETISTPISAAIHESAKGNSSEVIRHIDVVLRILLARYSWITVRGWIVGVIFGLLALLAGASGTALLFQQNSIIRIQTEISDRQYAMMALEQYRDELERLDEAHGYFSDLASSMWLMPGYRSFGGVSFFIEDSSKVRISCKVESHCIDVKRDDPFNGFVLDGFAEISTSSELEEILDEPGVRLYAALINLVGRQLKNKRGEPINYLRDINRYGLICGIADESYRNFSFEDSLRKIVDLESSVANPYYSLGLDVNYLGLRTAHKPDPQSVEGPNFSWAIRQIAGKHFNYKTGLDNPNVVEGFESIVAEYGEMYKELTRLSRECKKRRDTIQILRQEALHKMQGTVK